MRIYLSEFIHPAAVERLKSVATVETTFDNIDLLDGMVVRGVRANRELIEQAKNLKVIGRHGVGVETVDLEAAKEHGVRVLNAPLANATSTAEMIVARFLEMSRNLYIANVKLRRGEITRIAPPELQGMEVTGKTLGLIGMGNISQIVARMMKAAFQTEVYGYDPYVSAEEAARRGIHKVERLEELLEMSDLVSICVPLTSETVNMIRGDLFNHFKPNAVFVNDGRGKTVNEDDLYDALVAGKLAGAAFDVFAEEPLPKESKLLTLENFSATPHIGGNTREALYRTGMTIVENVINVIEGKPAEGIVV